MQRVELLRNDEWYQAQVIAVDVLSDSGTHCYKIAFEKDNPAGTSSSMQTIHYSYTLIPIEEAAKWLRPWRSEVTKKKVPLKEGLKNSVKIRFWIV